jgi:hypothetical protein
VVVSYVHNPVENAMRRNMARSAKEGGNYRYEKASSVGRVHYRSQSLLLELAGMPENKGVEFIVWDNAADGAQASRVENGVDFLNTEGNRYHDENATIQRAERAEKDGASAGRGGAGGDRQGRAVNSQGDSGGDGAGPGVDQAGGNGEAQPGRTGRAAGDQVGGAGETPIQKARRAKEQKALEARRPELDNRIARGAELEVREVEDTAAIKKLEREKRALEEKGEPSGNRNWPETRRWHEIREALKTPPTKKDYRLVLPDGMPYNLLNKTASAGFTLASFFMPGFISTEVGEQVYYTNSQWKTDFSWQGG